GLVVEGVALGVAVARAPYERFMRILDTAAAGARHWVGLAPAYPVQDPEAEILHLGADPEDIVVSPYDPDRPAGFQHSPRSQQPGACQGIISLEALELVPMVIDSIDLGLVRPVQLAFKLKIVWRIGEDHVDRVLGETIQRGDAISFQDRVEPFGILGEGG